MALTPYTLESSQLQALRPERDYSRLPAHLYVCGDLSGLSAPTIAIVGTRSPTPHGLHVARHFARTLSAAGICIISGLALGIDTAAHLGALDAGAPTIGVLAGGHNHLYPPANRPLAQRICTEGGGILSLFAPDEQAYPSRFLLRNGVITALADAVLIVEAPARSGALNTASWAADANIPLLVVPGDIERPKVAGCLALIRDGATLVRNTDDVFEALGLNATRRSTKTRKSFRRSHHRNEPALPFAELDSLRPSPLQPEPRALPSIIAEQLYKLLCNDSLSIEELVINTKHPIELIVQTIMLLQIEGHIIERGDGRYTALSATYSPQ